MESIDSFLPTFCSTLSDEALMPYIFNLIEETAEINSNCFLCMLIAFYLKSSFNVFLLSEKENLYHYSTILKKNSLNLNTNQLFYFVDIQSAYSSLIKTEFPLSETYPFTYNPNTSKNYISCSMMLKNNKIDYENLFNYLSSIHNFQTQNVREVLILDFTIGDINDINRIIKFCIDKKLSIVSTINLELLNDKNIKEYYEYLGDIIITFKANESGHSKDIDGVMKIILQSFDNFNFFEENQVLNESTLKQTDLRYSIKDNTIKFFTHLSI